MAWDQTRNDALAVRLYSFAQMVRALGWEAFQIAGLVEANGVMTDPAFADARGVAKDDAAEVIALSADIVRFLQNGPVVQQDRQSVLNRILGGPLT